MTKTNDKPRSPIPLLLLLLTLGALLTILPETLSSAQDESSSQTAPAIKTLTAKHNDLEARVKMLDERLKKAEMYVNALKTSNRKAREKSTPGTPTATPTPMFAAFTVNREAVNVRAGPGINYHILGKVLEGQTFLPAGKSPTGDWLMFPFKGQQGWVYAPLMLVARSDLIKVVEVPKPVSVPPRTPPIVDTIYVTTSPEDRCSPYNPDDYSYPQSVEQEIVNKMGGRIYSPYTGAFFASTEETDIEHIVARSEAHDSGLCDADLETRRAFARDLFNLTLADPETNRNQKRDKDAAEWMPAMNQCWFANRVIFVKRKYALRMDQAEFDALAIVLSKCTSAVILLPDGSPIPGTGIEFEN